MCFEDLCHSKFLTLTTSVFAFGCLCSASCLLWDHWGCDIVFFLVNMMVAPLSPHMVQRTYIATNDSDMRIVIGAMLLAPFIAQTPGIIIGLTKNLSCAKMFLALEVFKIPYGIAWYSLVSVYSVRRYRNWSSRPNDEGWCLQWSWRVSTRTRHTHTMHHV